MAASINHSVEAAGHFSYVVSLPAAADAATFTIQKETIFDGQPIICHAVPDGNDVVKAEFSPHPTQDAFIETTYGNINATIGVVFDFYAAKYRVRKQSGTGTNTKIYVNSPVPLTWTPAPTS